MTDVAVIRRLFYWQLMLWKYASLNAATSRSLLGLLLERIYLLMAAPLGLVQKHQYLVKFISDISLFFNFPEISR
jgi:hypothetical protein